MKIKIGSLAAIALCTFGLSGCFVFDKLPFKDSELQNLSETVFADELLDIAQDDLPEEAREVLGDIFDENSDHLTYTVSENLVLSFEKQEMGWHPLVFMKNDNHFMACEIIADDEVEPPAGVTLTPPLEDDVIDPDGETLTDPIKEAIGDSAERDSTDSFPPTIVSGTKAGMRDFVLDLVSSKPKVCVAVPIEAISESFPASE
ncbi:MAG: hypothetical protein AAGG51_24415 [Cyanobacteria bacterium P01_G01_bin.54]